MTEDLSGDAVRYEGDRPVAVGDLRLAQPTRMATTSAGFWGLYEVGDQVLVVHPAGAVRGSVSRGPGPAGRHRRRRGRRRGRPGDGPLVPALPGRRRPGRGHRRPRSRVEQGPPPTYDLSDERNTP